MQTITRDLGEVVKRTPHPTQVTSASVTLFAGQCACGWRGEPTVDRAQAELDASIHAHTIRFPGRRWSCSCGAWGYSMDSAEIHAHAVRGRIEPAGAATERVGV